MITAPMPYRSMWEFEVSHGLWGQDRRRPNTWVIDELYRAAIWQARADEAEQFVLLTMKHEAHPDTVSALLEQWEEEVDRTHRIYLGIEDCDAA